LVSERLAAEPVRFRLCADLPDDRRGRRRAPLSRPLDRAGEIAAYEAWGFQNLSDDLADVLGLWARFIYGPILDDRVRTVADGVAPGDYGRREAFQVKQALEAKGPVTIPREFVFMDRAAIGLGSAFLHLGAEHNWRRLFEALLERFSEEALAERQVAVLAAVGL
jgi:hypothetical protein